MAVPGQAFNEHMADSFFLLCNTLCRTRTKGEVSLADAGIHVSAMHRSFISGDGN